MFLTSCQIQYFKPFKFINVKNFKLDIFSNIHVIVARNGSGKTSLLYELNPLPAPKSNFDKCGYKQTKFTHLDNEYICTTDFNNKEKTHSFKQNGTELNENGSVTLQLELLNNHLGINTDITKLLYFNHDFCNMTKGERKNFLLDICPIDLSFVLSLHKKIVTKIKDNKSNLNLLHKRKSEIELQLIEKKIFEDILHNRQELLTLNNNLDQLLFIIKQDITSVENVKHNETDYISNLKRILKYINSSLSLYSDISRENFDIDFFRLKENKEDYKLKLNDLENQLDTYKKEIEELETILETNKNNKTISSYEKEINEITNLITKYAINNDIFILSKDQIESIEEIIIPILIEYVHPIIGSINKMLSVHHYERLLKIIQHLNFKLSSLQNSINNHEKNLEDLLSDLNKFMVVSPNTQCKFQCSLRENYLNKKNSLVKKIVTIKEEKQKCFNKFSKYQKALNRLETLKDKQEIYFDIKNKLQDLFNKYPFLYQVFTGTSIVEIINNEPMGIVTFIESLVVNSKNKLLHDELNNRKKELTTKLNELKEKNIPTLDYINKQLKHKKNVFNSILNSVYTVKLNMIQIDKKIIHYENFNSIKNKIENIIMDFKEYRTGYINFHYLKCLNKIYSEYSIVKSNIQSKLIELENIIKTQETLSIRLNEEINKMINDIEQNRKEYEYLEKSLSPICGIPHKYLLKFINNIINNINYFIKQVWTYNLVIQPINENIVNDFSFKIKVGSVLVEDISKCSSAQKAIINICFNLAILLHMDILNKYPLYMDEPDSTMDTVHQQKLLEFLSKLVDQEIITQLFLVNHHATISGGFSNSETICLSTDNIVIPPSYNNHLILE